MDDGKLFSRAVKLADGFSVYDFFSTEVEAREARKRLGYQENGLITVIPLQLELGRTVDLYNSRVERRWCIVGPTSIMEEVLRGQFKGPRLQKMGIA